jgi:hypothetical protein
MLPKKVRMRAALILPSRIPHNKENLRCVTALSVDLWILICGYAMAV